MGATWAGDSAVVLIVEDDADIRASTAESLELEGFAVVGAATVDDGLLHLRRGTPPAVVLLDLMMPGRNGWEFRREQLAEAALRDIPVVVITACGMSPESLRTEMGNVEVVGKPFSIEVLLQAIARASNAAAK
jgi:CheY-like chemotaxis protein